MEIQILGISYTPPFTSPENPNGVCTEYTDRSNAKLTVCEGGDKYESTTMRADQGEVLGLEHKDPIEINEPSAGPEKWGEWSGLVAQQEEALKKTRGTVSGESISTGQLWTENLNAPERRKIANDGNYHFNKGTLWDTKEESPWPFPSIIPNELLTSVKPSDLETGDARTKLYLLSPKGPIEGEIGVWGLNTPRLIADHGRVNNLSFTNGGIDYEYPSGTPVISGEKRFEDVPLAERFIGRVVGVSKDGLPFYYIKVDRDNLSIK